MTDTMLEKAAKAAWSAMFNAPFSALQGNQWEDIFRDNWMDVARAVLQAIREPDDVLASKVFYLATSTAKAAEHEERFTAMIDSILSKSQEGK